MTTAGLPVSNPTSSPWQASPSRYANHLSSSTLPESCEIAIIGTGLSGISTAWHLLHTDPHVHVTLLEARTLCSAASGRNGGHLTCDLYSFSPGLQRAGYGDAEIADHGRFEIDNFNALTELITTHDVDCELVRKKHYDVCASEEEFKVMTHAMQVMKSCNGPLDSVRVWKNPEASRLAGMRCHAVIEHDYSASINPYKLVTGMFEILMTRFTSRIALYTNTRVDKVSGGVVYTSRGHIKCQDIVLATNGYTAAIMPSLKDVIVPVRGQVISQHLSRPVQNCSFSLGGEYLSQRPNGAIVLGGGRRFAKDQEVRNADDSSLSSPVSSYLHHLATTLSDAKQDEKKEEWEWSGIMGFAKLGIPLAMQLPGEASDERSRVFVVAGFTGHGMPRILLSAAHISRLILNRHVDTKATSVPAGYEVIRPMFDADLADR